MSIRLRVGMLVASVHPLVVWSDSVIMDAQTTIIEEVEASIPVVVLANVDVTYGGSNAPDGAYVLTPSGATGYASPIYMQEVA